MNYIGSKLVLSIALIAVYVLPSPGISLKSVKASPNGNNHSVSSTQIGSTDEEEIRRVVTDSQFNETISIYGNPANFDKSLLTKYWVPENKGGEAIIEVENSVQRLLTKHWHYSKESANEKFEIRSIQISPQGDVAEVKTRERWHVPMVDDEGNLVKERESTLEYPVKYTLRKINGKWLIQKNSGPYRDRD